jgi:hypothetical protein
MQPAPRIKPIGANLQTAPISRWNVKSETSPAGATHQLVKCGRLQPVAVQIPLVATQYAGQAAVRSEDETALDLPRGPPLAAEVLLALP